MVNGSLREMWLKEEWRSTTKRNGIRNRIRIWMFIYSRRHHHQCSFHMIVHTECNFDSHAKQQSKNNFKYLLFLAFLSIYFIMSLRSRLKMSASLSWFVRSSYLSLSLTLSFVSTHFKSCHCKAWMWWWHWNASVHTRFERKWKAKRNDTQRTSYLF